MSDTLADRIARFRARLRNEADYLATSGNDALLIFSKCEQRIKSLETDLQYAKDDLLRLDGACWYCLNPEIEDAWRHDHAGDNKFHWHHCIDPGDGLTSDCAHSEMYERIWNEAQQDCQKRITELERENADLANDARLFVPGEWQCLKCGFSLSRTTLNVANGSVGTTATDREEPEACPNDGEPMVRESWEQLARYYMAQQGQHMTWLDQENERLKTRIEELERENARISIQLDGRAIAFGGVVLGTFREAMQKAKDHPRLKAQLESAEALLKRAADQIDSEAMTAPVVDDIVDYFAKKEAGK